MSYVRSLHVIPTSKVGHITQQFGRTPVYPATYVRENKWILHAVNFFKYFSTNHYQPVTIDIFHRPWKSWQQRWWSNFEKFVHLPNYEVTIYWIQDGMKRCYLSFIYLIERTDCSHSRVKATVKYMMPTVRGTTIWMEMSPSVTSDTTKPKRMGMVVRKPPTLGHFQPRANPTNMRERKR